MSDAQAEAERQLVGVCIAWECSNPTVDPARLWCAQHWAQAQANNQPGKVEPALEEKARRAGERALAAAREEQAPVFDQVAAHAPPPDPDGRVTFPVQSEPPRHDNSHTYVWSCARGMEGTIRQVVAQAALKALEAALRKL